MGDRDLLSKALEHVRCLSAFNHYISKANLKCNFGRSKHYKNIQSVRTLFFRSILVFMASFGIVVATTKPFLPS